MINWGDVPTWIAGLVAVGAAPAAYTTYKHGRDKEKQSQARQIHIACFPVGETERLNHNLLHIQPFEVKVWNGSPAPITDVAIMFSSPVGTPSLEDAHRPDGLPRKRYLEPGEATELRFTILMHRFDYTLDDLYARVSFMDAEGQRWTRLRNGKLFRQGKRIPYKMYDTWTRVPARRWKRWSPARWRRAR